MISFITTVLPSRSCMRTGKRRPPFIFTRPAPISKSEQTGSPSMGEANGGPAQPIASVAWASRRRRSFDNHENSFTRAILSGLTKPAGGRNLSRSRNLRLAHLEDAIEVLLGDRDHAQPAL